jgi:N-methylhydantoinase B
VNDSMDALDIEITRGRLQAIVDEAGAVLVRTAFSEIVREVKDYACSLLLADGRTVVQSAESVPLFLGTTTHTAERLLEVVPASELRPGDAVGTNDPWDGSGHLNDLTIVTPVFVDGELVALASVVVHLVDIGGRILPVDARQVFEEGFRIPPMRLGSMDQLDPVIMSLLRANVRVPDEVMGDIDAMLNACQVISSRLQVLCEEISVDRFYRVSTDLEQRAESFMRGRIQDLDDGEYFASFDTAEPDPTGFHVELKLIVDGDAITADFANSTPEVSAGVNCCLANTRAYVVYALKCLLAPDVPFNEGIFRPVSVVAPDESVVNSRFPAASAARAVVAHVVPTLVINALSSVVPHAAIGECGTPSPVTWISGIDPGTGGFFNAPVISPGGFGARAVMDGPSCLGFPANAQMASIEMLESGAPILFEERQLLPDSAGEGRFRGGLGQRVVIRSLADGIQVQFLAKRLRQPSKGAQGGEDGRTARIVVRENELDDASRSIDLDTNDRVIVETPGGGGYGPSSDRHPAAIERDFRQGYRTRGLEH